MSRELQRGLAIFVYSARRSRILIALIKSEDIARKILTAMHLPTEVPQLHPARQATLLWLTDRSLCHPALVGSEAARRIRSEDIAKKILAAMHLPTEVPQLHPARPPPGSPGGEGGGQQGGESWLN